MDLRSSLAFPPLVVSNQNVFFDESNIGVEVDLKQKIERLYNKCQSKTEIVCLSDEEILSVFRSKVILYLENKNIEKFKKIELISTKINYCDDSYQLTQDWKFTLEEEDYEVVETYSFSEKKIDKEYLPLVYLNGNEVEFLPMQGSEEDEIISNHSWDNWKEKAVQANRTYVENIYPLFNAAVARISCSLNDRSLVVIDLGGGDGALALNIAKINSVKNVYLLDNNEKSLVNAWNKKISPEFSEVGEKVDIIQADITHSASLDHLPLADVVTLCGVVAQSVITKSQARELLERSREILKEDGFVCIASHTPGYFSRVDFEEMGFNVCNMTGVVNSKRLTRHEALKASRWQGQPEPFYILQKHII